jgi:hypothetical protein
LNCDYEMLIAMQRPTQVFISYAHADRDHLDAFRNHFGPVERGRNLTAWFDDRLAGGQSWNDEIRRAINASDIFVCLITANFLNSNYIRETELPAIWQAVRGRGALMIPVILEVSFWTGEFGHVQCLPHDRKGQLKPAADWRPKRNGFHAAADQAAKAIAEWLQRLPPPPQDPGPGLSLLVTQEGFDLSPDAPAVGERSDPLQQRLLEGLRKRFDELRKDAKSCSNTHPMLFRDLVVYGGLIEEQLTDLDVVALVASGSALSGLVDALTPPLPQGSMTEALEPELRAGFQTLLREHARLVMGFAEGREIIARDRLLETMIDQPAEAKQTLHAVLEPMIDQRGLLTQRARELIQAIDHTLIEGGVRSTDALLNALRHGGRAVGAITRAVSSKVSAADAITIATFGAIISGDPNLETYRAAFRFLVEYAAQISAFASNQPELRRLVDWTMEQLGKRQSSELKAIEPDTPYLDVDNYDDALPSDFDLQKVHELIVQGRRLPPSWEPFVTHLNFHGDRSLVHLSPLTGLFNLLELRCSATSVVDLSPLSGLSSLTVLDCSLTPISDLSPIAGLAGLEHLDISLTSVEDLTPIAGLTSLKHFDCYAASVSDISVVAEFDQLTQLDISLNSVDDLAALSNLKKLVKLDCSHTSVSDLKPIAGLRRLQHLDCSDVHVQDLSALASLKKLRNLKICGNNVSDISAIWGMSKMERFDCSRNPVSDLSPLSSLNSLVNLNISQTSVSRIDPISALLKLEYLNCSNTAIKNLEPLSSLFSLTDIDCHATAVDELQPLANLFNLREIDCSNTEVGSLSPLSAHANLESLNVSRTSISDLSPISGLKSLSYLNCSDTRIVDVRPLSDLSQLTELDFSGTLLNDISVLSGLRELIVLDCSSTYVRDVSPVCSLPKIERLYLADLPHEVTFLPMTVNEIDEFVILGTSVAANSYMPKSRYFIGTSGDIKVPDEEASGKFDRYSSIAKERSEQTEY